MLPRVLVVDDNEVNRQLIEWALEGLADVSALPDGVDCCKTIRATRPDVIFLDLMMPGCSGFEVLEQMQAQLPGDISKVVVVTARTDASARDQVAAFGVAGWEDKPLSIERIVSRFEALRPANA
ncbi:MAG: response regulator [Alphaproteobacteria bacterium]|nr:response regulator [Alphaproteobacteria bacterium]